MPITHPGVLRFPHQAPGWVKAFPTRLLTCLRNKRTDIIVVDDAHDLSFEHLMFIKELTDQGRLQY
ncbi:MAG TPA: hypothetical protein VH164_13915, partial [Ktedonobacteraceae bacterium]|nr:hypothetical protein [Ktedonobacteraceae bacterium]